MWCAQNADGGGMEITTLTGRYAVKTENGPTWTVMKNKRCSCGGSAEQPCKHIKAVKQYLLDGGERAEPFAKMEKETAKGRITECLICGAPTEWAGSTRYPFMWRCTEDSSHYWEWYGRDKVRAFLTGDRPSGIPAVDEMSAYKEYLDAQCHYRTD